MTQGRLMLYACLAALALLGLCALTPGEADAAQADENPIVDIETSAGTITLELDKAKAPITVDNFIKYVDAGYYDGLIFHRVIPGFMIQGGGMNEKVEEKFQGQRPEIKNEASNGLSNKRGTIAMARTANPDSAQSQFFINLVDNARGLDPRPGSAGYAVFGKVTAGMEVVDAIAQVPTTRRGPHDDVPVKPILIKSAKQRKAKS
jgi:peptidyl-prolyl cis-trans isomerase A (cyclophilin A)